MAVHGAWQTSRTHSEADKKAFKRLEAELQAILPLPSEPFRKEGALFKVRLKVKATDLIHLQTRTRFAMCMACYAASAFRNISMRLSLPRHLYFSHS